MAIVLFVEALLQCRMSSSKPPSRLDLRPLLLGQQQLGPVLQPLLGYVLEQVRKRVLDAL